MEASIFTYIQTFSLNISCLTRSIVAGVPDAVGAVGLTGAGTLRVSMAVLM
jgi:hypothetical protein